MSWEEHGCEFFLLTELGLSNTSRQENKVKERKKIEAIREELQAAEETMLPSFILKYEEDERAGVQKLLQQAEKRLARLAAEEKRIEELKQYEREYGAAGCLCGIDEAGRGPLAGPVVAGAVILPKDCKILYINDSKKLSEKKREELYDIIMEQAVAVGIGMAGPGRIDKINILQATYEAMRQAIQNLSVVPDILLNDAVTIPQVEIPQVPIIHGDAKSISIGAASIIAKVTRDRLMMEYHERMPEYGFDRNKGYGTKEHIEAIRTHGPSPIHRQSFIKNFWMED
ncbi:MAG: ribonuclease HII [Lachnospiraceae bacterium]|nr:ribonuclease HII [Lachnospiraceae bacterium]